MLSRFRRDRPTRSGWKSITVASTSATIVVGEHQVQRLHLVAVRVQVAGHVGQSDGHWTGVHPAHKLLVSVGGDKQYLHRFPLVGPVSHSRKGNKKTQPLQVGLIWHSLGNTLPRSVSQVPRERQVSWLLAASELLQPSQPTGPVASFSDLEGSYQLQWRGHAGITPASLFSSFRATSCDYSVVKGTEQDRLNPIVGDDTAPKLSVSIGLLSNGGKCKTPKRD